jgi:uncharacterized repeat protein (TIGR03803 family)
MKLLNTHTILQRILILRSGCLALVLCATAIAAHAQTFSTLVNFDGTNGASPHLGPLVQGLDGNFYGTTVEGGAYKLGTVFKMTPSGTVTTIYSFCSQTNCPDGDGPNGGLVLGEDGNFYGTTSSGGAGGIYGTVFKITSAGELTTLHSFDGSDGMTPAPQLVQATNGNFYGTTEQGGANSFGTVFEITSSGTFTSLHSFDGLDGELSLAPLVQASNGDLYGTTQGGGKYSMGTVFQITTGGTFTSLYSFCENEPCADGDTPSGGLMAPCSSSL